MPLGTEAGLGPGNSVLDGDPTPHRKGYSSPHFLAHIYCGQMVTYLGNCWDLVLFYVILPVL